MANLEENYIFNCPYCMAEITIKLDLTGGQHQEFTYDCEMCCHPIDIRIDVNQEGISDFDAQQES